MSADNPRSPALQPSQAQDAVADAIRTRAGEQAASGTDEKAIRTPEQAAGRDADTYGQDAGQQARLDAWNKMTGQDAGTHGQDAGTRGQDAGEQARQDAWNKITGQDAAGTHGQNTGSQDAGRQDSENPSGKTPIKQVQGRQVEAGDISPADKPEPDATAVGADLQTEHDRDDLSPEEARDAVRGAAGELSKGGGDEADAAAASDGTEGGADVAGAPVSGVREEVRPAAGDEADASASRDRHAPSDPWGISIERPADLAGGTGPQDRAATPIAAREGAGGGAEQPRAVASQVREAGRPAFAERAESRVDVPGGSRGRDYSRDAVRIADQASLLDRRGGTGERTDQKLLFRMADRVQKFVERVATPRRVALAEAVAGSFTAFAHAPQLAVFAVGMGMGYHAFKFDKSRERAEHGKGQP